MKAVILAGGLGTRLSERTDDIPKPMVEIGGFPIIWHIIKFLSCHGINEFIILLGYKGYVIKEYFKNYALHRSDFTVSTLDGSVEYIRASSDDWKITLVDTGLNTQTGGRLRRIVHMLGESPFLFTYGDGLTNADIRDELEFHCSHKKIATMLTVSPPGRFGACSIDGDFITGFREKPQGDGGLINGGYFILNSEVFSYLSDDSCVWEQAPLERLALERQLVAYKHSGFWQPMDTLRDCRNLNSLWESGAAPWRIWGD